MPADNVYASKLMVDDIKDNNERKEILFWFLQMLGVWLELEQ